jgi:hypothetical protein
LELQQVLQDSIHLIEVGVRGQWICEANTDLLITAACFKCK